MDYFIKFDYQPEQGINSEELIKRIKESRISSNTMVRKVDSTEWKPLNSYPEFSNLTPPPLPKISNLETRQKAETLVPNKNKSPIPNYFLPVGRINGSIFFFRNIINFLAFGLLAKFIIILPEEIHILGIIPISIYIYLVIVTSSKRLHDWNITGWLSPFVFIPFIPLLFWLIPGNKNSNRFGERLNGVWRNLFTA
jgi:uncharacterized membrane protein YhaH (DUF805 family)